MFWIIEGLMCCSCLARAKSDVRVQRLLNCFEGNRGRDQARVTYIVASN